MASKPDPKPDPKPKPRRAVSKIVTGSCAKTQDTQIGPRLVLGKRW